MFGNRHRKGELSCFGDNSCISPDSSHKRFRLGTVRVNQAYQLGTLRLERAHHVQKARIARNKFWPGLFELDER
jgi:hypothetical protein